MTTVVILGISQWLAEEEETFFVCKHPVSHTHTLSLALCLTNTHTHTIATMDTRAGNTWSEVSEHVAVAAQQHRKYVTSKSILLTSYSTNISNCITKPFCPQIVTTMWLYGRLPKKSFQAKTCAAPRLNRKYTCTHFTHCHTVFLRISAAKKTSAGDMQHRNTTPPPTFFKPSPSTNTVMLLNHLDSGKSSEETLTLK